MLAFAAVELESDESWAAWASYLSQAVRLPRPSHGRTFGGQVTFALAVPLGPTLFGPSRGPSRTGGSLFPFRIPLLRHGAGLQPDRPDDEPTVSSSALLVHLEGNRATGRMASWSARAPDSRRFAVSPANTVSWASSSSKAYSPRRRLRMNAGPWARNRSGESVTFLMPDGRLCGGRSALDFGYRRL